MIEQIHWFKAKRAWKDAVRLWLRAELAHLDAWEWIPPEQFLRREKIREDLEAAEPKWIRDHTT